MYLFVYSPPKSEMFYLNTFKMKALKRSFTLVGFILFSIFIFAQSVEEAGAKYNDGNAAMKEKKYADAVNSYQEALKIAQATGPEAHQLKGSIQTQLVNAYMKNGLVLYKNKNYDASIANLEKGYALAKSIGDANLESKLGLYLSKIHSSKGLSLIKQKKLDGALGEFVAARKTNPKCVISYYGQGVAYKDLGQMTEMMQSFDKAIEYGTENKSMIKYVAKSKKAASKSLLSEATKELQKEHSDKAINYINDSFKYAAGDAETYYYLTVAYNKVKKYSDAVTAANKAISMKEGDKSDIYFQLGQALEGKGDAKGACAAYKKVTSGPNVEAAKYEITQKLKCG